MTLIRPILCFAMVSYAAVLALPAAASSVWNNGPINGTIGSFNINSGPQVFDSFTVSGGSPTLLGLSFGAWLQPNDVLQNVAVEVWTGPRRTGTMVFGASIAVTQSNCSTNSVGSAVCLE